MAGLATPLKGLVGGTTAGSLLRERGIATVGDLLDLLPVRYLGHEARLSGLVVGDQVVVVARVKAATTRRMQKRRGTMLTATITDGTTDIDITFFDARAHEHKLLPGARALFAGQVSEYRGRLQLAHPGYTILPEELSEAELAQRGPIPEYPYVKKLHNWTLAECVRLVLDHLDDLPDPLPDEVRAAHDLPDLTTTYRWLHRPDDLHQVERARERLRMEEALVLQTVLGRRRRARERETTRRRAAGSHGLLAAFDARLPFELTAGQREVAATLAAEMDRPTPMHRLLQGEVGSGKTVVALRAMLAAVEAGGQAALLAPTEVLAIQHHRSITAMLGPLAEGGMLSFGDEADASTRVVLLTGSMPRRARSAALTEIAAGTAGIVVGTHAIFQDVVEFHDLALVVVDEQHRFGVEQREALRAKGAEPPHVLVMTATPIPRTVAMTVYGDMETSVLRQLPRGRQPITTHVVPAEKPAWVDRTWERVGEEVAAGHQVYVVCPRIGDDGDDEQPTGPAEDAPALAPPAAVLDTVAELRAHPALAGRRIEPMHGRLPADEKDATMSAFAAGDVDVLVSTTVIEVGVDVANATVMVVRDADRFGISQLHQLRGRVGRGGNAGLCLLMTGSEVPASRERLEAVAATTDGFELARVDLTQRREGDVLGAAQSGRRSRIRYLRLTQDEEIIAAAREHATALLEADPDLAHHPVLRERIEHWLDDERAAFLEKG